MCLQRDFPLHKQKSQHHFRPESRANTMKGENDTGKDTKAVLTHDRGLPVSHRYTRGFNAGVTGISDLLISPYLFAPNHCSCQHTETQREEWFLSGISQLNIIIQNKARDPSSNMASRRPAPAGHLPPSDIRHHHYQSAHAFYNYHSRLPVVQPPLLFSQHSMFSSRNVETIEPAKLCGRDPEVPTKVIAQLRR